MIFCCFSKTKPKTSTNPLKNVLYLLSFISPSLLFLVFDWIYFLSSLSLSSSFSEKSIAYVCVYTCVCVFANKPMKWHGNPIKIKNYFKAAAAAAAVTAAWTEKQKITQERKPTSNIEEIQKLKK